MADARNEFFLDLRGGQLGILEAQGALQRVDNTKTFHVKNHLRPALGIYNVSTSRVFHKIEDLCERIEALLRSYVGGLSKTSQNRSKLERSLIDYIELSFYASADHVNDLMLVCNHFYVTKKEAQRDKAYQRFKDELRAHKRFVSAVANQIKHSQHRIRLYHVEFAHAGHTGIMLGYVIEGVEEGAVGPSPIFHSSHRSVFSVTAVPWLAILFVLGCSRSLNKFLKTKVPPGETNIECNKQLTDVVTAAARLPFYTMDEDDYLPMAAFSVGLSDTTASKVDSGLYGSLAKPWEHVNQIRFGRHGASFMGDGITRTFRMLIAPSKVSLRRVNVI